MMAAMANYMPNASAGSSEKSTPNTNLQYFNRPKAPPPKPAEIGGDRGRAAETDACSPQNPGCVPPVEKTGDEQTEPRRVSVP